MNLIVETYEVEEVANNIDDCAETRDLIAKLGLEGQEERAVPVEKGTNPYRKMTAEEQFIYQTLLPKEVSAKNYADGPIPLRVLQVLSHAKDLDFFTEFKIWCPKDATKDDPVLLGIDKSRQRYILARWGKVLESLDTLRPIALLEAREKFRAKYEAIVSSCKATLEGLDRFPAATFMGKDEPYFHNYLVG